MDSDIPPGKRKKVISKCPNPLFTHWLTQLKDEASSKGLKTAFSYGKALKSLKRYPLPLPDGKSCKLLESFGDKTCKYLDDKLRAHIDLYGSADFVPDEIAQEIPGYIAKPKKVPRKKPAAAAVRASLSPPSMGERDDPDTPRQRKKSGGTREYLPKPGSGPYAMLIALYRYAGEQGYMVKADLMRKAQPFCETSFTIPDPGSRYTAWSSMGSSLINKHYVIKRSSPAKYSLTPAGVALAQRLELDVIGRGREEDIGGSSCQVDGLRFMVGGGHAVGRPLPATAPRPSLPNDFEDSDDDIHIEIEPAQAAGGRAQPRPARLSNVPNFYEDGDDTLIENEPPPQNNIHTFRSYDNDVEMMSPAKAYTPKRTPSKFPGQGNVLGSSSKFPIPDFRQPPSSPIYIPDDVKAPLPKAEPAVVEDVFQFTYCTDDGVHTRKKDQAAVTISDELGGIGFLIVADYTELLLSTKLYVRDNTRPPTAGKVFAFLADKDAPETCPAATFPLGAEHPLASASAITSTTAKPKKAKIETVTTSSVSEPDFQPWRQELRPQSKIAAPAATTTQVLKSPWDTVFAGTSSGPSSTAGSRESSQDTGCDDVANVDEEPAFTLKPGSFEVILCVDKREHFGGAKSSKQLLMPELQKHQTRFELKNLAIGDFAWVARPKNAPEGDREVVLDYIVERKRMDDLSASICDKRFSEQKYRLHHCGLANPIYLVEDYGSHQHFSIGEDALNQSIVNTQVIDGFYVKRTKDVKESVAYLTLMTRYLEKKYKNKYLIAVSRRSRDSVCIPDDPDNLECRLLTYTEFNEGSSKRKAETIKELFIRQLMQIQRLTLDKALSILRFYQTPALLIEAYNGCQTVKQGENLLAEFKYNESGSKIGNLLSKQVYLLYTKTTV